MPILPEQVDIYPSDLLDFDESRHPADARWFAFYTIARHEKDLMRVLAAASVPFYAPLAKHRTRSPGGRLRESQRPLFPGYVFSRVDERQRRLALETKTISRSIPVMDVEALLKDLRAVKRLVDLDRPLLPEEKLEPGHVVKILTGALQGVEGTVVGRRGRERFVVAVRFLNRGVAVQIAPQDLGRVSNQRA